MILGVDRVLDDGLLAYIGAPPTIGFLACAAPAAVRASERAKIRAAGPLVIALSMRGFLPIGPSEQGLATLYEATSQEVSLK